MRSSMNRRNSSLRKYQDDSDTEEDLAQQHSFYSRKSNAIGNKTPITNDSYTYRNHNDQEDSPLNDRYDSEDISPEGKGLTIKQPIRTNIRRNSNNNTTNVNNINLNQSNKSSFIPKEVKNHKMKYEEDHIKNNSSNNMKLNLTTKSFLIDEKKQQHPPVNTFHSLHDSQLEYKTRKKPVAHKFIPSSGYNNISKEDNIINNSMKQNENIASIKNENTSPIKNEHILRRNLSTMVNESEDEYFSQESNSNDLQDFNDISIEPTSRLNIIQDPFTVKHAFQISPNKSLHSNSNQINIKKLNCIPLLSESKDVIDDEEDSNSIELLDSESIIDNNYLNNDDDDDKSKESNYTFDPTIIKDGEFYSDYLEKSKNGVIKSNKSGRYDEGIHTQTLTKIATSSSNNINNTTTTNNNNTSNNTSYNNNKHNIQQQPISGPSTLLKSSWVSVKLDQTSKIDLSTRFSFVQVAHISGIKSDRIHCTVIRDKKNSLHGKMYPSYVMILEETNKPIIIAQKMNLNRTSNYHLFDMTRAQLSKKLSKKSGNYIGKLRATNVNRTEYVLLNQNSEKEEIAGIRFDRLSIMNQFKEGNQPRKMKVMVPLLDENRIPIPNRVHDTDGSGSLAEKLLTYETTAIETESNADLYVYESKDPIYENGNYRLNFSGRVNLPSVKNFQMVARNNINDIICQFGKVDEDVFHLDYKSPVNACQAFAFALCQFNL